MIFEKSPHMAAVYADMGRRVGNGHLVLEDVTVFWEYSEKLTYAPMRKEPETSEPFSTMTLFPRTDVMADASLLRVMPT